MGVLASASAFADEWSSDLPAALARAAKESRAAVVIVASDASAESGEVEKGALKDARVAKLLQERVVVRLDADRQKDWALRYEPQKLPAIVLLSSRGAIVDRTSGVVAADDLAKRLEAQPAKAKEADDELAKLEQAVAASPRAAAPRRAIADFWRARGNDHEALVPLGAVAQDATIDADARARSQAWLDLVRALLALSRFDDAASECDAIVRAMADDARVVGLALYAKGFACEQAKRWDDAKTCYRACREKAPGTKAAEKAQAALEKLEQKKPE